MNSTHRFWSDSAKHHCQRALQIGFKRLKSMSFRGLCHLEPHQGPLSWPWTLCHDGWALHSLCSLRFTTIPFFFSTPKWHLWRGSQCKVCLYAKTCYRGMWSRLHFDIIRRRLLLKMMCQERWGQLREILLCVSHQAGVHVRYVVCVICKDLL